MSQRPTPTGRNGAVCAACHAAFTSVSAFDKHQRLTPSGVQCRPPHTVGLQPREKGTHLVWGHPGWDVTQKPMPWAKTAA